MPLSLPVIGEAMEEVDSRVRPITPYEDRTSNPLDSKYAARAAALSIFCDPVPQHCSRLRDLSSKQWRRLLHWLHTSGLALYFLDRIVELQLSGWVPASALAQLQQDLADNTLRTRGMIDELMDIQREFQQAEVIYAVVKGLSLWPTSVPKPELRCQFDLDFLVAGKSLPKAREVLESRKYRLYAMKETAWEFKLNEKPGLSIQDIYKASPSHAVELHVEPKSSARGSLLDRVEWREVHSVRMPVLAPVDLFLGQGLHAYKHVCGEFSRAAHLLEFRRHMVARYNDGSFWSQLQSVASENPKASLALGIVALLIEKTMGDFAPEPLTFWTVDRLPAAALLWVDMYGRQAVYGSYPGSKFYLFLQRELERAIVPATRPLRQSLLPLHLPPPVIRAFPNETFSVRLNRYRMHVRLISSRLRFHVMEGFRYACQLPRWRRRMNRLAK